MQSHLRALQLKMRRISMLWSKVFTISWMLTLCHYHTPNAPNSHSFFECNTHHTQHAHILHSNIWTTLRTVCICLHLLVHIYCNTRVCFGLREKVNIELTHALGFKSHQFTTYHSKNVKYIIIWSQQTIISTKLHHSLSWCYIVIIQKKTLETLVWPNYESHQLEWCGFNSWWWSHRF